MDISVPDVIASNQPSTDLPSGFRNVTFEFDVKLKVLKFWARSVVPNLTPKRTGGTVSLKDLSEHLESHLSLPSGHCQKFSMFAVCNSHQSLLHCSERTVPLVCDEILNQVVKKCRDERLQILVVKNRSLVITHTRSCREKFFGRTIKNLDIPVFLPQSKLAPENILSLCHTIFEGRACIKHSLRKGVWMHLVKVFPPELTGREQRESYIEKLRLVYDSLKGNWRSQLGEESPQLDHLVEAVQRDAVRTDPGHSFYTGNALSVDSLRPESIANAAKESNVQKLVNIITIYILEHDGVSYTQGMTDLLSPILYVMKRESDAYITFAAMIERIKLNFNKWCEGTLLKIERLRHICQVLDPELFNFLTSKIEEDAFALFFGMVLIECRREFSFDDSMILLESIWAGAVCMRGSESEQSRSSASAWAKFMTYNSEEVIQQAFGEAESPYSAQPLSPIPPSSALPSMISAKPIPVEHKITRSMVSSHSDSNLSVGLHDIQQHKVIVDIEVETSSLVVRQRSYSDSIKKQKPSTVVVTPNSLSSYSHSDGELTSGDQLTAPHTKPPKEMTDLSSVSTETVSSSIALTAQNSNGTKSTKQHHRNHGTAAVMVDLDSTPNEHEEIVTDDSEYHHSRVTPVAFFDLMGSISSNAALNINETSGNLEHSGTSFPGITDSRLSLITSQLTHGNEIQPHVDKQSSLCIRVSDCFPLFICMSILSQHRARIMNPSTDFVELSRILKTQAGRQDVHKTLYVARDLYRMYQSHQISCIGNDPRSLNTWLDDEKTISQED